MKHSSYSYVSFDETNQLIDYRLCATTITRDAATGDGGGVINEMGNKK